MSHRRSRRVSATLALGIGMSGLVLGTALGGCGGSEFSSAPGTGTISGGSSGSADASGTSASGGQGAGGTSSSSGGGGSSAHAAVEGGTASGGAVGLSDGGGGVSAGGVSSAGGATGSGGTDGGVHCASPATWYPDNDGDGYGTDAGAVVSCSSPAASGWAPLGGDCNDGNPDVHPQTRPGEGKYFGSPYSVQNGGDSYDYDCSGTEEGDPAETIAAVCILGVTCSGSGYVKSDRTGTNVNPYCGSHTYQTCGGIGICQSSTKDVQTAYRCK